MNVRPPYGDRRNGAHRRMLGRCWDWITLFELSAWTSSAGFASYYYLIWKVTSSQSYPRDQAPWPRFWFKINDKMAYSYNLPWYELPFNVFPYYVSDTSFKFFYQKPVSIWLYYTFSLWLVGFTCLGHNSPDITRQFLPVQCCTSTWYLRYSDHCWELGLFWGSVFTVKKPWMPCESAMMWPYMHTHTHADAHS